MMLDATTAREWYRQMRLIRVFEERCAKEYQKGHIGGFLHLYIGEEAIAVGTMAALEPHDHIITHYRDHGHAIARGMNPRAIMAELFGKATGVAGGRGGSMHLVDRYLHFWGGHAIVGGHLPIATGLAYAAKARGQDAVVLTVFGEGATNIGMFHESLNLAALWKLPCIFLCENNRYGMGTAVARASAVTSIKEKARAYGMPGVSVNGMDPEAVNSTLRDAARFARDGRGPILVEAETYRFVGHSMGDPERYRSKDERQQWQESSDPVELFRKRVTGRAMMTEAEADGIDKSIEAEVEECVRFATESPYPEGTTLHDYLYVEQPATGGE